MNDQNIAYKYYVDSKWIEIPLDSLDKILKQSIFLFGKYQSQDWYSTK
jgi:hypothetical protein